MFLDTIKDRKILVFKKEEDKIQEKDTVTDSLSKFKLQKFFLNGKIVSEMKKE